MNTTYSKSIEEMGEELTVVFEIWILLLVPTVAPQLSCPFLANQHEDRQVPNVSKHSKGNQGNEYFSFKGVWIVLITFNGLDFNTTGQGKYKRKGR